MKIVRSIWMGGLAFVLLAPVTGCKRTRAADTGASTSSLIFGTASPEAQQALATPVDFRLTEENFAEWEAAQRNLDALPRSAIPSGGSSAADPIDRAVERLESSPRARTAIERTGLTVRDFVLETIALAQATEALATANSSSTGRIPPENLQFVQAHRSRMLLAERRRQAAEEWDRNEAETSQADSAMAAPATALPADVGASESADSAQRSGTRIGQRSEQRAQPRDTMASTQPREPARDSARDTIPPPR
jgi:uncharacterized protein (DUF1778 family)